MDPLAWQTLAENSHQLTVPTKVGGLISPTKLDRYLALFGDVLRGYMERTHQTQRLRLYMGGVLDNNRLYSIEKTPPQQSEPLHQWANRVFGEEKFGMILNNLENFSNALAQTVAGDIAPLLELTGIPLRGLALLFFMGNYGFTPFGVHKDNPGEEGFLFHIGPGPKTFYIWETKRFLELSGGADSYSHPEEILAEATRYELQPGDLMFFPSGTYHVADTPEFSVSMVLDFIRPSTGFFKQMMVQQLAKRMETGEWASGTEHYLQLLPFPFLSKTVENLTAELNLDAELNATIEDYLLRLRSNGGFFTPSKVNTALQSLQPTNTLRNLPPFAVQYKSSGTALIHVYARGHRTAFNFHPALPGILEELSSDAGITVGEVTNRLTPLWTAGDVVALTSALQNAEAIVVEQDNQAK